MFGEPAVGVVADVARIRRTNEEFGAIFADLGEQASKALRKLTGLKLETSDDWKRWWAERK